MKLKIHRRRWEIFIAARIFVLFSNSFLHQVSYRITLTGFDSPNGYCGQCPLNWTAINSERILITYVFSTQDTKGKRIEKENNSKETLSLTFKPLLKSKLFTNWIWNKIKRTSVSLGPFAYALKSMILMILWTPISQINRFLTIFLFKIMAKNKE